MPCAGPCAGLWPSLVSPKNILQLTFHVYLTEIYTKMQEAPYRDEFTVKILHSSFCDPKIELRSSWCDLCSSFFLVCFGEEKNVELRDAFPAQPVQGIKYFEGKKIVLPLQR